MGRVYGAARDEVWEGEVSVTLTGARLLSHLALRARQLVLHPNRQH
jgi:hypothetical protein